MSWSRHRAKPRISPPGRPISSEDRALTSGGRFVLRQSRLQLLHLAVNRALRQTPAVRHGLNSLHAAHTAGDTVGHSLVKRRVILRYARTPADQQSDLALY